MSSGERERRRRVPRDLRVSSTTLTSFPNGNCGRAKAWLFTVVGQRRGIFMPYDSRIELHSEKSPGLNADRDHDHNPPAV
jgi:hypothetical protein